MDAGVTPLFSRQTGVLSEICERLLPHHPRLASVLCNRFTSLNVSPTTAERFIKTLLEHADIARMKDLDLAASIQLEQDLSRSDYQALTRSLCRRAEAKKQWIVWVMILALRLQQKFAVVGRDSIISVCERRDVSPGQVSALLKLYVRIQNALTNRPLPA